MFDFSSDLIKNAPDLLNEHLAIIIKAFVTHADVTANLLATLLPIVKDKLADLCDSKNYRSIAISSLILKLLDWVILLNYGYLEEQPFSVWIPEAQQHLPLFLDGVRDNRSISTEWIHCVWLPA